MFISLSFHVSTFTCTSEILFKSYESEFIFSFPSDLSINTEQAIVNESHARGLIVPSRPKRDEDAVNQAAAQALQSAQSAVSVSQGQTTTRPKGRPIFLVDFANSRFLDPRFTFLRNSVGTYVDRFGSIKTAQINKPR